MSLTKRILIALGVLLLHPLLFFIPAAELFIGYILIFNPPWFRNFLNNLAEAQAGKAAADA